MYKSTILISLFLIFSNLLFAQNKETWISRIRAHYKDIKTELNTYQKIQTEILGESTEGAQGIAYYDQDKLKLIEIIWYGETGKKQLEYYFHDNQLIFAFEQNFEYNRPIYWDEKTAQENNDSEIFDPEKTTIKENRYYFHHETLFLWLDHDKKEQDLDLGTNSIVGKGLLAHCSQMKGLFKNKHE